jgi:cytochrome c-type protein NapC
MHSTFLADKSKTCIDCHKGIAHHLPNPRSETSDAKDVPGAPPAAPPASAVAAGSEAPPLAMR